MATINLVSTAGQDVIIQRVLDKVNAERAAQVPPLAALTIPQYITSILVSAFQGWKQHQDQEDLEALKTAWSTATTTQKNQVKTTLGVS
jgi:hypothetical protein